MRPAGTRPGKNGFATPLVPVGGRPAHVRDKGGGAGLL
jgi:hypothetical protein